MTGRLAPLRPSLVMMSWRGGSRLDRCLESIARSRDHFDRVILSITSDPNSADMKAATEFASRNRDIEVLCTGTELPTMQHQAFWIEYLERTGMQSHEWLYWLAYDDEVRPRGIEAIVDSEGNWPLNPGTAYFGPWAMRHESADTPFDGPRDTALESWTSFPVEGPTRMPVLDWIGHQLAQPTYMQMSGSVMPFGSFQALHHARLQKSGPMRIEMVTAASWPNRVVEEFAEPVSIIYGRPNSDRAAYGKAARAEDVHLLRWLGSYLRRNPSEWTQAVGGATRTTFAYAASLLRTRQPPAEEWRVRGIVEP